MKFAAIYHGMFNMLQLTQSYIGTFIPIVTYIAFVVMQIRRMKAKKKK